MKTWQVAIKDVSQYPEKVVRGTLLGMGSKIIKRSPVDTGRFTGNWQFTINAPASGTLSNTKPNQADLISISQKMDMGNVFYMTNNLPYGERLEYGYSAQAPQGMVRITLGEYSQILELEAKKL